MRTLVRGSLSDNRGNVGITFGMMVVPAVMFIGGAIDIGIAYKSQRLVQTAADAAVLAATSMPSGTSNDARQQTALSIFNANVSELNGVVPTATANGSTVTLTATGSVATSFLKIANIDSLRIGGSSSAAVATTTTNTTTDGGKVCLLALDPAATNGFKSQGTPNINYTGCWAHTNSATSESVAGGGSASVVGAGTTGVGGVSSSAVGVYSPAPVGNQPTIPDPFATVSAYVTPYSSYRSTFVAPTISSVCKASNLDLKKGTFALEPGRYCGGINIQAQATVTFAPGEYIIDNGEFNVQSGSSISGSNVLFYFSGAAARFTIIGGGSVNLKGRTSGDQDKRGFLFMAHPNAWRGLTSNIQGGANFTMEGMIYAPTQNILITGNGDANGSSKMLAMVAKSFEFRGNGVYRFKPRSADSDLPDILPNRTTTTTVSTSTPVLAN